MADIKANDTSTSPQVQKAFKQMPDGSYAEVVFATSESSGTTPFYGQLAMTGSAIPFPVHTATQPVVVEAPSTNVASIVIGGSGVTNVTTGAGNGYILEPGGTTAIRAGDTSAVYAIGTANDVLSFNGA